MTHSYQRSTAAGNTFIVMNTWEAPLSLHRDEMVLLVRHACDRMAGIGADGLILINQSEIAAFRMDFYNPDGTTGMLCGNGARCAVDAARVWGLAGEGPSAKDRPGAVRFEVLGAVNSAEIASNGDIIVEFQPPSVVQTGLELPMGPGGTLLPASYVDVGSQHVVVLADDLKSLDQDTIGPLGQGTIGPLGQGTIETLDLARIGPLLRWHPAFAPAGVNANIIEIREDGADRYLRIRTFERGVEAETQACGTGCMSSAIIAHRLGWISALPVQLLTQSGEFVTVDFEAAPSHSAGNTTGAAAGQVRRLRLAGPVVRGEVGAFTFEESTGAFSREDV